MDNIAEQSCINLLPVCSVLGDLTIEETFVYYDGPRLFVAATPLGIRYLALFVDEDETSETYLYTLVTDQRLAMVRSGELGLRNALVKREGPAFEVHCKFLSNREVAATVSVAPNPLPTSWLPNADVRLNFPLRGADD